jgi:hypothetical protein
MRRNTRTAIIGGAVLLAAAAGTGIAVASGGGDDDEPPITGGELDRASAAALEHTGGGTVTETEIGDEESWYEVEVTLEDGSQVDVQLDQQFNVVGAETDEEDDDRGDSDEDD